MISFKTIFTLFFTFFIFASSYAQTSKYKINIGQWPEDVKIKILEMAPEVKNKEFSVYEMNQLLKKIDEKFNFSKLSLVKTTQDDVVDLVGEIAPELKHVNFEGLSGLSETEALTLMGLNNLNILEESNLESGINKLTQYYREEGYRSATATYSINTDSTIYKTISFKIDRKKQTTLTKIELVGISNKAALDRIQSYLNEQYWKETLNQENLNKISVALRTQLNAEGYYLTANASPQIIFAVNELNAKLKFQLDESQPYNIEIIHSYAYSHSTLEEDVLKLESYNAKDTVFISDLIDKLKSFYISNGHPHINVTSYETKKNGKIYLTFDLSEGPRTSINQLDILGQLSRPESFYKDKFYELSSPKVQSKLFLKEDIEVAAKNLLIYLQNEGFVKAKLNRLLINTDKERPQNGQVVLQIDEGEQIKVSSVEIIGVSEKNKVAISETIGIKPEQNLSLYQLEQAVVNIKNYYLQNGYLEANLKNQNTDLIKYSDENSLVHLKFEVEEGPQIEVMTIATEGNTRTNDRLIMLELDFKSGEILTPNKIEESISRLQRTGLFNSVEITTLEKDSAISQRTVVVKVSERDPGVRLVGVGFTNENNGTLHGYTGIAYRNFFGWGVGLSARAEFNYNFAKLRYLEQKYTLGFVWPYMFETRTRFRTSVSRSNTISDVTINKVTESNSAVFSLERDFTSHFTGIFSYSVSTFKDHGITAEDEQAHGYFSTSQVIGSVGPTLDLDYRDNLFNPTKGSFTRLAGEYASDGLGNNNVDDFYRVTAQTTHYFALNDNDIVFAQSLRAGYVVNIDSDKNEGVPFDKRGFTLGGRTTIRGFDSSEFFPSTDELGATYKLVTSARYQLVKSELRFPLWRKYELSGAIFYDGGKVEIAGQQLIDGWRDAAGIGIRYNLPVGPLNLEYAFKLDKKTGESDGAFHLSIGVF